MSVGAASDSRASHVRPYGKYFLIRRIAEGGMAEIFLAKQVGPEGFDKNVVIKRMLPHLSALDDFIDMFKDEARIAARLSHQNIVNIIDLGVAEGCFYICMEYLAGEDLSTILRTAQKWGQHVPLNIAARVVIEAANGLHYAHEFADEGGQPLNIVHRDVSPSNIFVTYQGQVKVLDFGVMKADSRDTRTTAGVVKGKYMYMAPEQAEGKIIDRRADVFSLGVSLYECVTNVRPFARENDLAILNAVLKGEFHPPRRVRPELPKELEDIIVKAMASRPEDRYQTAEAFSEDLRTYLGSTTSAGGVDVIGQYVRSLVGAERVAAKTRIPSWAAITKEGKSPANWNQLRSRDPVSATAVIRTPAETAVDHKRRTFNVTYAVLVALTLGVAGMATWQTSRPSQKAVERPTDAGAVPIRVVTSDAVPPSEVEAAAPPDAGRPRHAVESARIRLTPTEIQKVVSKGQAPIMRCFERYKEDLQGQEGQVTVKFTILGTGRVSSASVTSGKVGDRVNQCLEDQIGSIRFPAHKDKEVTLSLPFAYRVRR